MLAKSDIEAVMYGRASSPLIEALLRPLSLIYRTLVMVRTGLYRAGILRRKSPGQTVISVGNLTLGGTGKTPAVMNIAGILRSGGRRPAVVSRGYGRKNEAEILVVSDGERVLVNAATGGDEPVLIGSKVKGVPVVVGSDRYRAAVLAHQLFGNDCLILDDGFQHLRLHRDLDIVLVDAADPFGNGRLFPAGILREPLSALVRAQVVMITGSDRVSPGDLELLRQRIRHFTGAKIFSAKPVPSDLIDIATGEVKQLSALRGSNVLALAGIARPAQFLSLLKGLGAEIKAELIVPDHYNYEKTELARLFRTAADEKVSLIVTTEKDAARLSGMRPEGIWALRIELVVLEKQEWETVLLEQV